MAMRWIVGVDLRDLGAGAVAFARWMAPRATQDRFVAAHVVDFEVSELFARVNPDAPELRPPYVDELLAPLRVDPVFEEIGSIPARAAEDGLEAAARDRGCHAMIIGRRKPAAGRAVIRLGRVARRLLRTLPMPIVVVPPDAKAADFSGGPVLVATQLGPASEGAIRFGAQLAASLDLDLLVTSVAVIPDELPLFMPHERWRTLVDETSTTVRHRLLEWVAEHGLASARTSVVEGQVGPALLEVAKVSGASMIVVGSRELGTLDRLVLSSVGSELAASAPIPVAVVPPDWSGHEAALDLDSTKASP
jgi:nucleotide-binding universal stress UspA family protein